MVRLNAQPSVGKLMNVYSDMHPVLRVLNIYLEVPISEAALWMTPDLLTIEADWKADLGGMVFASQRGLRKILQHRSVTGQFRAQFELNRAEGLLAMHLASVGKLKPLETASSPLRCKARTLSSV